MGKKGAKLTDEAIAEAEELVERLQPLGDVSGRKMFGGIGIFCDGVMFAKVTSSGAHFLRVSPETRPRYEAAGSESSGKMPYMEIPAAVEAETGDLLEWAGEALEVARDAKK